MPRELTDAERQLADQMIERGRKAMASLAHAKQVRRMRCPFAPEFFVNGRCAQAHDLSTDLPACNTRSVSEHEQVSPTPEWKNSRKKNKKRKGGTEHRVSSG